MTVNYFFTLFAFEWSKILSLSISSHNFTYISEEFSMKKLFVLSLIILVTVASCSDDPVSDSVDRLTLGTGLGRGTITGVTQSFIQNPDSDGVLIQWMLESRRDISGGYIVSILIEQKIGNDYVNKILFDYEPTEDYPVYYYIDSFYHDLGTGSFRATCYVGNKRIASQTYTVH